MPEMKKNLKKIAFSLTLMMFASKCLGLLRDVLLAFRFGTSNIVDAYTVSLTFINVAFSLFTVGFSESYITVYTRVPTERKSGFFNNTFTIIFCGTCILCAVSFVLADYIAYLMAPGFNSEAHIFTKNFIKIMALAIPFHSAFAMLSSNEMGRENFMFPRFCDFIVINVITIYTIFLSNEERVYILPVGYVIANFFAVLLLYVYSIRRKVIVYKFQFNLFDADFKSLLALAIPLGISYLINDVNTMSDGIFASTVGVGVTSALSYANKVQTIFLTVTVNIISVVCFPRIAKYFAVNKKDEALYYLKKSTMIAVYIAIPFVCFLLLYSKFVVRLLFERGNFNSDSVDLTSKCLFYYCLGIPFYAMNNVENQALAANAKQKKLLYITFITVVINIVLDFILLNLIGFIGLPIATCIAGIVQFFMMKQELNRMEIQIIQKKEIIEIIKILTAILIASLFPIVLRFILDLNGTIISIVIMLIFASVYIVMGLLMNIEIEKWLLQSLFLKKANKDKN